EAAVFEGERRHGESYVLGEQCDELADVASLECGREPLEQLLLLARPGRGRRVVSVLLQALLELRACSLERARHRLHGRFELRGDLAGAEAENVVEDQGGPLAWGQQLERGDEGERDGLVHLVAGLGAGCGVPKLASWLQIRDFLGRAPSLGTPHAAPRSSDRANAASGR